MGSIVRLKLVLVTVCVFLILPSKGQVESRQNGDTMIYYYDNNVKKAQGLLINKKKEGKWHFFTRNNKIKSTAEYQNDKLNGLAIFYDTLTGQICTEGWYDNDKRSNGWKYILPSGEIFAEEKFVKNELVYGVYFDSITGVKISEGKFKNGKRYGDWTFYHASNGKISSFEQYTNGVLNGKGIFFDINESKKWEGDYKNGKRDGNWLFYFVQTGKPSAIVKYSQGVLSGPAIYYDTLTGNKKSEGTHENDKREGEWWFYKNGNIESKKTYHFGLMEGIASYYDTISGMLESTGEYKNNKKEGKWSIFYFNSSSLWHTVNYENDSLNGMAEYYDSITHEKYMEGYILNDKAIGTWKMYKHGQLSSTTKYINSDTEEAEMVLFDSLTKAPVYNVRMRAGVRYGMSKAYTSTGKLMSTYYFVEDTINGPAAIYDTLTGRIVEKGQSVNYKKEGEWEFFNSNGLLTDRCSYKNDIPFGRHNEYDSHGQITHTWNYYDGVKNGEQIEYYASGKMKEVCTYRKDTLDGAYVEYDSLTGKILTKGNIVKDNRDGTWSYYYGGINKLAVEENYVNGVLNGKSVIYDTSGNKVLEVTFVSGKKNGKYIGYKPRQNRKIIEINFVNDSLHGALKTFYESGELKRTAMYNYGVIVYDTCFTKNGQIDDYYSFWIEPEFPDDPITYIGENLQYPEEALKNKIEGKVLVRFAINEVGKVIEVSIVKGIGYGCDEEALRIISHMPDWKPLEVDGQPYKTYKTLPVVFWIKD